MGHLSDRRLSRGEENAVAIIGLRRAAASRRWVAGQGNEVSVPSVMNAVFDNPKLMAKTIFRSWFKRLGIKLVVRSYNTRNSWIQLPSEGSVFDARFLESELGTCWEVLVKPDVMAEVRKLITGRKDAPKGPPTPFKPLAEYKQNPLERDAVTGRHSILGSPEGHQDLETGKATMEPSGCLQAATPALSPHNAAEGGLTMEQPLKSWDVLYAEEREKQWRRPSDPATVVEDLNNIDRLLDEAEQMSQVGYQDGPLEEDPDPAIMPAPERPSGTVNVTLVHEGRRIVVPPEARGLDEEDD